MWQVYLVLWYRELAGKPLYSFDLRGRPQVSYWINIPHKLLYIVVRVTRTQQNTGQPIQPLASEQELTSGEATFIPACLHVDILL